MNGFLFNWIQLKFNWMLGDWTSIGANWIQSKKMTFNWNSIDANCSQLAIIGFNCTSIGVNWMWTFNIIQLNNMSFNELIDNWRQLYSAMLWFVNVVFTRSGDPRVLGWPADHTKHYAFGKQGRYMFLLSTPLSELSAFLWIYEFWRSSIIL